MSKCPACDKEVQDGWMFCPACGMRLDLNSIEYPLENIIYLWERKEKGKFLYDNFKAVRDSGVMPFTKVDIIRPKLGNYTQVYVNNLYQFSLLYLAPALASDFYKIGKIVGYYTAYGALKTTGLEKAVDAIRKTNLFMKLFKISKIPEAQIYGWPGTGYAIVEKVDVEENQKTITYWHRYTGESACHSSQKPTCLVELGILCGHQEAVFGILCDGIEKECESKGATNCVFEVHLHDDEEEPQIISFTRDEMNNLLDEIITKIAEKKPIDRGKLGEDICLVCLQSENYIINTLSPGHAILSKHAGRVCGERIAEKAQLQGLDSALAYLEDMFLYLKAGILQTEKAGDRVIIRMKESVYASGVNNIHQNLCIFLAGIIEGSLNKATGQKWDVSEMKCIASGFPECEFWCKKI
jgi:predicted hydrocarbon binding protein